MMIEKEMKMKNHLFHVLEILTLCALLAVQFGCASSPPTRFYLLSSLDTTRPEMKPSADERCFSIGIGPVRIPEYLNQPKIVTRGGGNQLKLAEFDQWSEGLNVNITRVLAENLSVLLCTKTVAIFPWRGGIPLDYRIELDIQRFDGHLGGDVSLDGWWRLLSGDGKTLLQSKRTSVSESAGGGDYESLVLAQSRTLEKLSHEVAEAIKTLPK
jgi:uncharacterized lipoprotein YmbA